MIFKPIPLSVSRLETQELAADKKSCRRVGPCGIGKKALYLSSYLVDRCYYIPCTSVQRVFKRVAMSEGGFSGKGAFATLAYLVVEYDDGKQKQCSFKYEQDVDEFLTALEKEHPQIKRWSAAAEEKLAEKAAQKEAEERSRPALTRNGERAVDQLDRAIDYLEQRPELSKALSKAASRRRAYQCSKHAYHWAALAITLLGAVAMVYGIYALFTQKTFAIYFTLFGFAAIFAFAGFSVLPTARNNRSAILRQDAKAQKEMEGYLSGYPDFPLPARYAHPIVLRRMKRAVEFGRAATIAQALEVVKQDLKALNADVQVSQEEYDEVVAIKPIFLNADYQ